MARIDHDSKSNKLVRASGGLLFMLLGVATIGCGNGSDDSLQIGTCVDIESPGGVIISISPVPCTANDAIGNLVPQIVAIDGKPQACSSVIDKFDEVDQDGHAYCLKFYAWNS